MSESIDILKVALWDLIRKLFCLTFGPSERVIEYRFVKNNLESSFKRVLEVGGANSNLAFSLSKKGFVVDVIDVRNYPYKHRNLSAVQGDIIKHNFNKKYDGIILVSTIEHIGMGVYGDPEYDDGDFEAMDKIYKLLAGEGISILTTHYVDCYHDKNGVRFYDEKRLSELVKGFKVVKEEYYVPTRRFLNYPLNWVRADKSEILDKINHEINEYALVCLFLKKDS